MSEKVAEIQAVLPEDFKRLEGRQIAIWLQNTISHLATEMSEKQIKSFCHYLGEESEITRIIREESTVEE